MKFLFILIYSIYVPTSQKQEVVTLSDGKSLSRQQPIAGQQDWLFIYLFILMKANQPKWKLAKSIKDINIKGLVI